MVILPSVRSSHQRTRTLTLTKSVVFHAVLLQLQRCWKLLIDSLDREKTKQRFSMIGQRQTHHGADRFKRHFSGLRRSDEADDSSASTCKIVTHPFRSTEMTFRSFAVRRHRQRSIDHFRLGSLRAGREPEEIRLVPVRRQPSLIRRRTRRSLVSPRRVLFTKRTRRNRNAPAVHWTPRRRSAGRRSVSLSSSFSSVLSLSSFF